MNREKMIQRIKEIIGNWGSTTTYELELDHSPCLSSIGNGKNNVSQLIEHFNAEDVTAVTYHDQLELGEEDIKYEDLDDDILDEVAGILEIYDLKMRKEDDSEERRNFGNDENLPPINHFHTDGDGGEFDDFGVVDIGGQIV